MIQRPITSYHSGWRKAKDRIFFWLVCLFSALTAVPLVVIIWEVVRKGYKQINLNFFTETAPSTLDAMLAKINGEIIPGGIANGITGTLLMVVLASVIAIPTGIMGGIYLSEKPKTLFSHVIRFLTDLLQGTPSIVIGIIAYAWVVVPLSSYSALAGSVALAIMMLPLIIRSTEETLKLLPTSRSCARSLLYECYPESLGSLSFRRTVHRYFTSRVESDGRNSPPDANRPR